MLEDYNDEILQLFANIRESSQSSSGCSGGSDTGNNSLRQQHLGGAVYISACETKLDTIVFMHKWNIVQFWAQLELSSLGDFIDSRTFRLSNGNGSGLLIWLLSNEKICLILLVLNTGLCSDEIRIDRNFKLYTAYKLFVLST
uniref:Uncharacterized protein n=1 Tax=Onchocerca volvulus TaxID=6282 RepID=A0A8R1TJK9_ONCVO